METCMKVFSIIIMLLVFFALGGIYGHADFFKNSIVGTGSMEQRTAINGASDIASIASGTVVYKQEATWNDGTTTLTFNTSFEVTSVKAIRGVPFSNKYSVGVYSNGYKHRLVATGITGDFTGSAKFLMVDTSLDSVILMDSTNGSAKFRGSVINMNAGKHPLTESETLAIGKFVIEQELNINTLITVDNWLGFCDKLNRDMILADDVPDGIYIQPDGYKLVNGHLVKI